GEPCAGNPKPRLWRLPKHKSIVVYYGLKNPGCTAIAKKLAGKKFAFPLGISVAKTNCPETVDIDAGIRDYVKAFQTLEPYADYLTINISCPNAYGGQPFTDEKKLEQLLGETDKIKTKKSVFLKISPDLSKEQINQLLKVTQKHNVQGWIISNLTKEREKSGISPEEFSKVGPGGLSGKLVEKRANEMISYVYQKTGGKLTIIGVGGIFTAEDAYEKIRRGASLLQMITGMIFEGPQVVGKINHGLVKLLEQDGYQNIAEAVGAYHRKYNTLHS
ncbi:MAG: dihydroorotate dehydrogenase (quinone), partial [Nanoarchaeota archaeon]